MKLEYPLDALLEVVGEATTEGDTSHLISGIASLSEARAGDLSFLGNRKYQSEVPGSKASYILVPKDYEGKPAAGQVFVRVENPSLGLARVCSLIESALWPKPPPGVHPSAIVADDATIGDAVHIGPLCVVEGGARIGDGSVLKAQVHIGTNAILGTDCFLFPHVLIGDYCKLGARVRVNAGAVIGSDGFGFENVGGAHEKVPQIGNVVVENDVEIGANVTIDRARLNSTIIGEGTKIDNLVQIGHNVVTGKSCLIVSQVGISGSTTLEDNVILAGQTGVIGHIRLGKGTIVGAQGGVVSNTTAGFYLGSPALPHMQTRRIEALRKRLPEIFKRVSAIEKHLSMPANQ